MAILNKSSFVKIFFVLFALKVSFAHVLSFFLVLDDHVLGKLWNDIIVVVFVLKSEL